MEPQKTGFLRRAWRVVRVPVVVIVILYVGVVIYRIPAVIEKGKTKETVEKIHAQKLTLKDVTGENLPPEPDVALKDATVAGVDANANGIRDDVELAIFKLHPDSVPPERSGSPTRIRAAELQYAMALQNELTKDVFNSETFIAAIRAEHRAGFCLVLTVPKFEISNNHRNADETYATAGVQKKEIDNLVVNIETRKNRIEKNFDDYMTSFSEPNSNYCDVDIASLPS